MTFACSLLFCILLVVKLLIFMSVLGIVSSMMDVLECYLDTHTEASLQEAEEEEYATKEVEAFF